MTDKKEVKEIESEPIQFQQIPAWVRFGALEDGRKVTTEKGTGFIRLTGKGHGVVDLDGGVCVPVQFLKTCIQHKD